MSQNKFVRGCVAGLVVACALIGITSRAVEAETVTPIPVATLPPLPQYQSYGAMVIDPAGTFAYVKASSWPSSIAKINLITSAVTTIALGGGGDPGYCD
jgi:hypothetical protein